MTSDNSYTKTLTVAATPDQVYAALTDPDQVTSWWKATSTTGSGYTGGQLQITFGTEPQPTVLRVLATHRPNLVIWEVTASPLVPDWKGTQPTFSMVEVDNGCRLNFTHHGLAPVLECFEMCNIDWGQFLQRLGRHAEQHREPARTPHGAGQ